MDKKGVTERGGEFLIGAVGLPDRHQQTMKGFGKDNSMPSFAQSLSAALS